MTRNNILMVAASLTAALVLCAITIPTLKPWIDEAWASVPAWMLSSQGYAGTPSMDGTAWNLKDLDRYSYWIPPLFVLLQAAWFSLFSFSLETLRTFTALCGVAGVGLAVCFMAKLEKEDRAVAILTGLFLSINFAVVSIVCMGRAEGLAFLFQMAAYAGYQHWRERHLGWAVLAGQTGLVASGLAHPNAGLLSGIGLACLVFLQDRKRLEWRLVPWAAAPCVAGALGWGYYILQNVPAFIAQYGMQTSFRFIYVVDPWGGIRHEAWRYLQMMGLGTHAPGHSGPIFLKSTFYVALFAAATSLWISPVQRKNPAVRTITAILVGYLVFFTFLEGTKAAYYMIYIMMPWCALLAIAVRQWWRSAARPGRLAIAAGVAALLAIQAGGLIQRARKDQYHNEYGEAVRFLKQHAKPGQLVIGSHELGFSLGFTKDFLDDFRLGTASGRVPDFIVFEEIYDDRMEMLRKKWPSDYRNVQKLLAEYREVYNHNNYRILARQPVDRSGQ